MLTLLSATRDVKPAYTVLINLVAKAEFSNALYADPSLFIIEEWQDLWKNQQTIVNNIFNFMCNWERKPTL